jgi:hypothetical protein
MLSYAHGLGEEPLLGETIGANLERTVARVPDADALVCVHQGIRYTTPNSARRSTCSPAGCWRRGWNGATGPACGARTAASGRSSSTPPPSSA